MKIALKAIKDAGLIAVCNFAILEETKQERVIVLKMHVR
jgi:hypothetical protein